MISLINRQISFSNVKPPVFEECEKMFGISWDNTVFAYNWTIHAKDPEKLSQDVIEHETVHFTQQEKYGGAEKWWKEYLSNPTKRLEWEIEAYRHQYRYLKKSGVDRNALAKVVWFWANQLSGKGYGYIIKHNEAIKNITC